MCAGANSSDVLQCSVKVGQQSISLCGFGAPTLLACAARMLQVRSACAHRGAGMCCLPQGESATRAVLFIDQRLQYFHRSGQSDAGRQCLTGR